MNFMTITTSLSISQVSDVLLALIRAYNIDALKWSEVIISLIPSTAITEVERACFHQALSDAASGTNSSATIVELADVCR